MAQLLEVMPEYVLQWLVHKGKERRVAEKEALLREGEPCTSLFIVLDGLFDVFTGGPAGGHLERLAPGAMAGEISFFTDGVAPATVVAAEPSLVLELPRSVIGEKLEHDHGYAADLYRALLTALAGRYRRLSARLQSSGPEAAADDPAVRQARERIDAFKGLMLQLDKEGLKGGMVSEDGYRKLLGSVTDLMQVLRTTLGESSLLNSTLKQQLGVRLQHEMLPYLLTTGTAERFYAKPRGYAGDFLAIQRIYDNQPAGTGRLGPVMDRMFLESPPAVAVRNRRKLLAREILATVEAGQGAPVHVMCIASGPAAEVFDAFDALPDKSRLKVTLLDIDLQALAYVDEIRARRKLGSQIELVNENLVGLFLGRGKLAVESHHLIYSIGLIDYLNDKLVSKLLAFAHERLCPGGRVLLGNFHPANPAREYMDHVLEWSLIHRTEEDMNRLFCGSPFHRSCTRILFEESGINLFAECVREGPAV